MSTASVALRVKTAALENDKGKLRVGQVFSIGI